VASSEYLAYDWTKFHPVFLVEEKRSGGTYAHERARARNVSFGGSEPCTVKDVAGIRAFRGALINSI